MREKSSKLNRRDGVLVCGAYGMLNAGDEGILEAIVSQLRSVDGDMPITVLSRSPEATSKSYGVRSLHMFSIPAILKTMARTRLYINGGGSLIQDITSSRSLWYYLFTLAAGKIMGCRVLMYGCGIGPVNGHFNRRLTAFIINRFVDEITLREESSLRELRSYGVTTPPITVAADPAIILEGAPAEEVDEAMKMAGLDPDGSYACLCIRDFEGMGEKQLAAYAAAADHVYNTAGLIPVFLVSNPDDEAITLRTAGKINAPFRIISMPLSPKLVIGILSRMKLAVSVRLHGLIFAASRTVPIVGIAYDPKISAFLDSIGHKCYTTLEELEPDILCSLVDRALSVSHEELEEEVRRLKQIESKNLEAVRRLMGKE